jgi:hypothetical protein
MDCGMDAGFRPGRRSRGKNREILLERHFNMLRMLPPGKNF